MPMETARVVGRHLSEKVIHIFFNISSQSVQEDHYLHVMQGKLKLFFTVSNEASHRSFTVSDDDREAEISLHIL